MPGFNRLYGQNRRKQERQTMKKLIQIFFIITLSLTWSQCGGKSFEYLHSTITGGGEKTASADGADPDNSERPDISGTDEEREDEDVSLFKLAQIFVIDNQHIRVQFNEGLGKETAEELARWQIISEQGLGLSVISASRDSARPDLVNLTTSSQIKGLTYTLRASGLVSLSGSKLDPKFNEGTFTGSNLLDISKPELLGIYSPLDNQFVFSFSEAVIDDFTSANIAVCLVQTTPCPGPDTVSVTPAWQRDPLNPGKVNVTLSPALNSLDRYFVTVDGVLDPSGNAMAEVTRVVTAGDPSTDSVAPTVTGVSKVTGDTLALQFSEDMDAASIQAGDFKLSPGNQTPTGVVVYGNVAYLTFGSDLAAGSGYSLEVTGTVKDKAGNALKEGIGDKAGFSITNQDTQAPRIFSVEATSNTEITVTYSEPVDPETATVAGNYSLTGARLASGGTITCTDSAPYQCVIPTRPQTNSDFELSVSGIEDLAGNTLAAGGTHSVQADLLPSVTAVTSTSPTSMRVYFSESLSAASTSPSGWLVNGSGVFVTGVSFTAGNNYVDLTTVQQQPGEAYDLEITEDAGVEDQTGNGLDTSQQLPVVYGNNGPPIVSSITSTAPGFVQVRFSEAINLSGAGNAASALNPANYTIDGGPCTGCTIQAITADSVLIDLGGSAPGSTGDYSVILNNSIEDLEGNGLGLPPFTDSWRLSPTDLYAIGPFGSLVYSGDNGASWDYVNSGTSRDLNTIVFNGNESVGLIGGDGGTILRSTDGITWTKLSNIPTGKNINEITFAGDNQTAWAVADDGTLLVSEDGGASWTIRDNPLSGGPDLNAVAFIDELTGYAVGDDGAVLKTTDGGATWIELSFGTDENFTAIDVVEPDKVLITGDQGSIYSNEGNTFIWNQTNPDPVFGLNDIVFLNENDAVAVGNNGTVLTSSDGGASWTEITTGVTEDLYSIEGTALDNLTITGTDGTVLTLDGKSGTTSDISVSEPGNNVDYSTVDDRPGSIEGVASVDANSIIVYFNEPVLDDGSANAANNPANYDLGDLDILGIDCSAGTSCVITTSQQDLTNYEFEVPKAGKTIEDANGNAFSVDPGPGATGASGGSGNVVTVPGSLPGDTTGPTLVGVNAVDENTIQVVFSEGVDPLTALAEGNYQFDPDIEIYNIQTTDDPAVIEITLSYLDPENSYELTVGGGITDLEGNPLDTSGSSPSTSFEGVNTEPPYILATSSTSTDSVEVIFSEGIDPDSLDLDTLDNITILYDDDSDPGTPPVEVTISGGTVDPENPNVLILDTNPPMTGGEEYTIVVAGAEDEYGNTISGPNTSTFIAGELPEIFMAPTLTVTESDDGETRVAQVQVFLSSAVGKEVTAEVYTDSTASANPATAGTDYTEIPMGSPVTVTFAPGVTQQSVPVTILGDNTLESPDESFLAYVQNPLVGVTALSITGGAGQTEVTILNDDALPELLSITSSSGSGSFKEGDIIPIELNFTTPVSLAGATGPDYIEITLSNGQTVQIDPPVSGTTLTGNYTVGLGDDTSPLNVTGITLINGDSALLQDAYGNDADLTLPAGSNLSNNVTITLDTVVPGAPDGGLIDFDGTADDSGVSNSDGITNVDTDLTFDGDPGAAEPGSTVTVYNADPGNPIGSGPGVAVGTATVNPDGSFTLDFDLQPDGTYDLYATTTDPAGNESVPATSLGTVTIDTEADEAGSIAMANPGADDTGISNADNITQTTTFDLEGTAEPDATITVYTDSSQTTVLATTSADGAGDWSTSITLPEGTTTPFVVITDVAGNTSSGTNGPTFTIDNTAPSTPGAAPSLASDDDTGESDSDGITSQTSNLTFSGVVEAGATVEYFVDGASQGTVTADGSGNYSFDISPGAGSFALKVTAADAAGNVSADSPVLNLEVDTSAPAAPAGFDLAAASDSGVDDTDDITNIATGLQLSGTAEAGASVEIKDGAASLVTVTADGSGDWSATVDLSGDGDHSLTAIATDPAGNPGSASAPFVVTLDTTASDDSSNSLAGNNAYIDVTFDDGVFGGDGSTGGPIEASDLSTVFNANGGTATNVTVYSIKKTTTTDKDDAVEVLTGGETTVRVFLTVSGTVAGTEQFTLSAVADSVYDSAGNASSFSVGPKTLGLAGVVNIMTASLAADNSYVEITFDEPAYTNTGSSGALTTSDFDITFTANGGIAGVTVSGLTQDDGVSALTGGETVVRAQLSGYANATGVETIEISAATNEIYSSADTATPDTETTGALTFNDKAAPAAPDSLALDSNDDTGASDTDGVTSQTTGLTISGNAETGSSVELFVDGASEATTTASGGTFSFDIDLAAGATYTITAKATDTGSNESAASTGLDLTIDTTGPASAPSGSPDVLAASDTGASDTDNITSATSITFSATAGTVEGNATVEFFDGGTKLGEGQAAADGSYSITIDLSSLANTGAVSITSTQTDLAGNGPSGVDSGVSVTIDTNAPSNQNSVLASSAVEQGGTGITIASSGTASNEVWLAPAGQTAYGDFSAGSTMVEAASGTATSINTPADEGTYYLYVIDLAGNVSAASTASVVVDNTAPTNQDTVLASSSTVQGGVSVTIASSGTASNQVWLAPSGQTVLGDFSAGSDMTQAASGTATSISAPADEGTYYAYVIDEAGNVSSASSASVTVDNTAPANQDTVLASSTAVQGGTGVTIVSSGDVANQVWLAPAGQTDAGDFSGGSTMTQAASGTATSVNAPADEGTYYLYVIDEAGNVSSASSASVLVDDTDPTDNTADPQFTDGTDYDGDDIAVTWTAFTDPSGSGIADHRLYTSTSSDCSGATDHGLTGSATNSDGAIIDGLVDGTYYLRVRAYDAAGNSTLSACSTDTLVVNTALAVTIEQAGSQGDPVNSLPVSFDVVFTQEIDPATFTTADITQNGTATVTTWNISNNDGGVNKAWTLEASTASSTGTIIPSIDAGLVEDVGNTQTNLASSSTDNSVNYTLVKPNVTIEQASGQGDPVNSLPVTFDVQFSIPIDPASFVVGDITQNGTATGITWSITNTGDDAAFTLEATAVTGDGTLEPSIAAGVVDSPAGNTNNASSSTDGVVDYDTTPPTANISGAPTGTNNVPVLDVDVSGTGVVAYQYKVGEDASIDCSVGAGYSSDVDEATNITDDISGLSDGDITLCVLGRDEAGNLQTVGSATSTTWTKDSAIPVAEISGEPTGTNNTTVLNVDVAGTDIQNYMYKVGESGSTDCSVSGGYSSSTAASTNITDNISGLSDGLIKLCVVGQNSATTWQPYASATVATWTKDTTAPTFVSAETIDSDGNGKIDHYKITFSGPVDDSTFPGYSQNNLGGTATGWVVGASAGAFTNEKLRHGTAVSFATDTEDDEVIYLSFDELAGTCNAGDQSGCNTGSKPDLTMTSTGLQDPFGNDIATIGTLDVAEADKAAPVMVGADPPSNLTLNVFFSEGVTATTAECGTGSSQTGTDCSTLYAITGAGTLNVSKAIMADGVGANDNQVVLSTDQQTNAASYTVTATADTVLDVNNNANPSGSNDAAFLGDPPSLVILSASSVDNTTVEVTFNENVTAATAETASNYSIGGLTVSAAETYPTSGVNTSSVVRLTTSSQLSDTYLGYTLTITSGTVAATSDGKTVNSPNNTAYFTGDKLPEVQAVVSVDETTVDVIFSEDMSWSASGTGALNYQNYCIETTATKTTDCTGTTLSISAAVSAIAQNKVRLTTGSQVLDENYTLTIPDAVGTCNGASCSNIVDTTGNFIPATANYGNFIGRENIKILSARSVSDSSSSFDIFRVIFSKPFEYDAAGTGTNSVSNMNNWDFPAGLNTVSVCTSADDGACPISYTEGIDTVIFFKTAPEPAVGAYTVVGATTAGDFGTAAGCISAANTPAQCLKGNPDDRASVSWNLPEVLEDGAVYTDPFNDNVTLSGQVIKYNNKLLIGPNDDDSGLFMTDINLTNSTSITLDADDGTAGNQPFKGDATTYIPPNDGVYEHGTTYLGGIDYFYAGCYSSDGSVNTLLSGADCSNAGGTEYLFVLGYVTEDGGYQSNWLTTDTTSPFIFKHIEGFSNAAGLTYRAMSIAIFKGWVYQASQHENGSYAVRWNRFRPGATACVGDGSTSTDCWGMRGRYLPRIGENSGNSKRNGQHENDFSTDSDGGLISIDSMFEYDVDGAGSDESQLYIANGGTCHEAGGGNSCLTDMVRNSTTEYDGGILRTTLAYSTNASPPGLCSSQADCENYWEDVTPDNNTWNRFMSIPLPQDARGDGDCSTTNVNGVSEDWDCLIPSNTIRPAIKAIPKMVEFNGDMYIIRNACASNVNKTLTTTIEHVCASGQERPQLWRLPSGCTDAANCVSSWEFIGDGTNYTTTMAGAEWVDGSDQATKAANNIHITLLVANGDKLYVGFDNHVNGLNVWRTKDGVTSPTDETDFEAVCQTGNACFQPEKQFGMVTSGVTDKKIFDAISVNDAGTDYLIFNSRNGTEPMRVYRTSND